MTNPVTGTATIRIVAVMFFVQLMLAGLAYAEPPAPPLPDSTSVPVSAVDAPVTAERDTGEPGADLSLGYVKGIFVDTGKLVASPIHWETGDWLKVGAVAATTGGLYLLDDTIRDFAQSHQNSVAHGFATVGNDLGNPLYTLPPVGAFYLYGYLTDNAKARKTALLAVESLAISSMFTEGIKMLAERDRPGTGASPSTWDGPHLSLKNVSFSSGHTSSAFSIATVFAERYKDTWYVPPIAYGLATLTGLSRIYGNEHWASDVFFGAALGYFVGKAVVSLHPDQAAASKISIVPNIGNDYKGITVRYKF